MRYRYVGGRLLEKKRGALEDRTTSRNATGRGKRVVDRPDRFRGVGAAASWQGCTEVAR